MPPENNNNNSTTKKPTSGAQFRKKFEDLQNEHKDLQKKFSELQNTNLIHEAGLTHLSERQRKALYRSFEEGEDITVDTLKSTADELGFKATEPTTQQQTGDGSTPSPTNGDGNEPPEPDVTDSITGLTAAELAHVMANRGTGNMGSFEEALKNAKTKEETEAVIRSHGAKVGIMHELDVE